MKRGNSRACIRTQQLKAVTDSEITCWEIQARLQNVEHALHQLGQEINTVQNLPTSPLVGFVMSLVL